MFHQIPALLGHTLQLVNEFPSHMTQSVLVCYLCAKTWIKHVVCKPFSSRILVSYSSLALLNISLADFQSQMLWGLIFSVLDPWDGEPSVGLRALTPQGEPPQL